MVVLVVLAVLKVAVVAVHDALVLTRREQILLSAKRSLAHRRDRPRGRRRRRRRRRCGHAKASSPSSPMLGMVVVQGMLERAGASAEPRTAQRRRLPLRGQARRVAQSAGQRHREDPPDSHGP